MTSGETRIPDGPSVATTCTKVVLTKLAVGLKSTITDIRSAVAIYFMPYDPVVPLNVVESTPTIGKVKCVVVVPFRPNRRADPRVAGPVPTISENTSAVRVKYD